MCVLSMASVGCACMLTKVIVVRFIGLCFLIGCGVWCINEYNIGSHTEVCAFG
jgi:hypothetical protein